MLIPDNEKPLPLIEAIRLATGRTVNFRTAWRWHTKGNRYGIRLETWLLGGRRVTSVERVKAYNERATAAAEKRAAAC